MKIKLIWVGKTKERFILEGINKYIGFLKPFAEVSVTVIKEEKGKDIRRMTVKEGERIERLQVPYVLLDEQGRNFSSAEFARFLDRRQPAISFVLGGAYGVSDRIKASAQDVIALSHMTLTHEMARLLLAEQLYRAFTILHKRGYHH
jgi:23S rRNA (pseudouridine1915-N3)-methyltransferase